MVSPFLKHHFATFSVVPCLSDAFHSQQTCQIASCSSTGIRISQFWTISKLVRCPVAIFSINSRALHVGTSSAACWKVLEPVDPTLWSIRMAMGNVDHRQVMDWDEIISTCLKSMSSGRFLTAILVLYVGDNSLWSWCSWFAIRSQTIMWRWWWSGRTMINRYSCSVTPLRMISISLTWYRTPRELVAVVNITLRLWVIPLGGHCQLSLDLFLAFTLDGTGPFSVWLCLHTRWYRSIQGVALPSH